MDGSGLLLRLLLIVCCLKLSLGLKLTIVHVNDLHSHFEEVNENSGRCHEEQAAQGQCFGGQARIQTKITELRETHENVLVLNAGDFYQGTIWYSLYKYEPVIEFGNMVGFDVMAFGNHEFDDGVEGVRPLTLEASYSMVAANMIENSGTPQLKYSPSEVIEKDGVKVGIIGYVTTDTPIISNPGSTVQYTDEIEAITKEAAKLKSEGVDVLIALGHSGYDVDQRIAQSVPDIDAVVGGHSHSFLYSGDQLPSIEIPEGEYPTYVTQASGKVVPVVQAFCFSKYIGMFTLNLDEAGELLTPVDGTGVDLAEVILLDSSVPMDPTVLDAMQKYRDRMSEYYTVIGSTDVLLSVPPQKNVESNLGDCVADSMAEMWDDTMIAFINNGGLRADLIAGEITGEDIFNVLPFNNTVDRVTILGEDLKNLLEAYASGLCPEADCDPGTFLQVSGLRVVYDIRKSNVGDRVQLLERRCGGATLDSWCPFDLNAIHAVALPSFLADGGSKTLGFPSVVITHDRGPTDFDAFESYVRKYSPIMQMPEGRITVNYYPEETSAGSRVAAAAGITTLLSLLLAASTVW